MEEKTETHQILLTNEVSGRKKDRDGLDEMRIENDNLKLRLNL
jgi:hypothetical protein